MHLAHYRSILRSLCLIICLAVHVHVLSAPSSNLLTPAQQAAAQEWSRSIALQAAIWGSPLVTMYALRYHDALRPHAKALPNSIWRMENISTPELSEEAGYVTPNVNVVYGFGFMDLRQEPIILQAPDSGDRYYMIEIVDMWTNAFAYVGGKSTGYQGGTYALVGPGWNGELPKNVKRINCPTPWVLIQPRVHIYSDQKIDLTGAKKILEGIQTVGLSSYQGKAPLPLMTYSYLAPEFTQPRLPVSILAFKDPLQFWEILSQAMNENPPPPDQIAALLPLFKPLGLEMGKTWDRTKVNPTLLSAMKEVVAGIGKTMANIPIGSIYQGAFIPPATIGNFGNDYLTRAVTARVGLTANTPYEAIYWMYISDGEGHPLTGSQKYTMTFKEEIPFDKPGFWSLTLYDATNNYTVANPINRYMIGSDSADLKKEQDGSFTLYIQQKSPGKERESNWLPAPKGTFYLIARSYAPTPEAMQILSDPHSWPVPAVVPVK